MLSFLQEKVKEEIKKIKNTIRIKLNIKAPKLLKFKEEPL
jgi:transcriptional regulator